MRWRSGLSALTMVMLLVVSCSDDAPGARAEGGTDASSTTVDPNGGYPSLAPPTTRAVELTASELGGGFTIPRHGSCGGDLEAELSRVSSDGDTAWIVDVPWSTGSPLVDREVAVGWFSAERDGVYAVDLATGERLWQRFFDDRPVRSAVAVDGVVAVSLDGRSEDSGALIGLDARTGDERWRRDMPGFGGVVAVGGAVVAQPGPGVVAGFDPQNGATVWEVDLGGEASVSSHGDLVVAAVRPATLVALDPATGAEEWRWSHTGSDVTTSDVLGSHDGVVAVEVRREPADDQPPELEAVDTELHVLDLGTGLARWSAQGSGFRFVDSFLIASELVGSADELQGPQVLVSETGAPLRRLPAGVGDDIRGSGGGLLVERFSNADDGTVTTQVVDPFTGEVVWTVGAGIEVTVVDRWGDLLVVGEAARDEWEASGPTGALVGFDTSTAGRTWRVSRRDRLNHAPTLLEGGDLLVYSSDTRQFCD